MLRIEQAIRKHIINREGKKGTDWFNKSR